MFEEFFCNVNNENFSEFTKTSQDAIIRIVEKRELLVDMLKHILDDPVLLQKTESYDFLDKMVVYSDDDTGIFARISLFHKGYGERIHYHRWNYSSYIISGGYTQKVYGTVNSKKDVSATGYEDILFQETMIPGCVYSLDSSVIHSIHVLTETVSFCIRGKALRDRFQIKDTESETVWWQYGSSFEAEEERTIKQMPSFIVHDKIDRIKKIIEKM